MSTYIVGIDAGGTNTRAALYDESGAKLSESKSGFGNMTVDPDSAMRHMGDVITGCLAALPDSGAGQTVRIYVGSAGIHAGRNSALLDSYLKNRFPEAYVRIEDDAMLALYAITQGKNGILAIAGTGSIAYGKRDKSIGRIGGWGNILGDEGSGYDICRRALVGVTAEFDDGREYSALSKRILRELQTDVWGIVKFVHTANKGEIAALLPVVEEVAQSGGVEAEKLLEDAGAVLASMVLRLSAKMNFGGVTPVVVKGGVLEKTPKVFETFCGLLGAERFEVRHQSASSELGAYYLFEEERSGGFQNEQRSD